MAEITWIKLKTDMFEHDKIKLIEALPDSDTIIVIWVKLLAAAGKANSNGFIMLTENIPMNEEEMATIFSRPLNTVRLALQTFKRYGMVEVEEDAIRIKNWENHQNVDGMDRVRKLAKERVQKHRERKKLEQLECNVTVTQRNSTDIDKELDIEVDKKEIRKEEDKDMSCKHDHAYSEILDYLNLKAGTSYRSKSKATQTLIKARMNEGFTIDNFKTVIDKKVLGWLHDPNFNKFLRPATLFGTKFEGYLNERVKGYESSSTSIAKEYTDGINF